MNNCMATRSIWGALGSRLPSKRSWTVDGESGESSVELKPWETVFEGVDTRISLIYSNVALKAVQMYIGSKRQPHNHKSNPIYVLDVLT
jgi:hypothetical protein